MYDSPGSPIADATPTRPLRPRPSTNHDNAWFWDGCRAHELRVQTFSDGATFYPPVVRHPETGEMPAEPQWQVASGLGTLYSFAVVHHPQVPAFDYPLVVGLVELDGMGVRIVANIVGCDRADVHVGMPLEVCWLETHPPTEADPGVTIPQFRPAAAR